MYDGTRWSGPGPWTPAFAKLVAERQNAEKPDVKRALYEKWLALPRTSTAKVIVPLQHDIDMAARIEVESMYPVSTSDEHLLAHVKTLNEQLDTWKRDYWRQAIVLAISTLAHLFCVIF